MNVYEFADYKTFVHNKVEGAGPKAHGLYARLAKHLNIHSSMVSQIFNGIKQLTFEQACGTCEFFGLTELETDHFIALVQLERAGTEAARAKCRRDLARIRSLSDSLKNRIARDVVLSENDNVLFYSHWYYTATKLLSSMPGHDTPELISKKLGISLQLVNKALTFLISVGLCVEQKGKIKPGPANTHLGAESPLIARHHQNWRVKGFEKMTMMSGSELFFTMPGTLSEEDALILRQKIVTFIEDCVKVVDHSKGQTLRCLNVDWFNVCS